MSSTHSHSLTRRPVVELSRNRKITAKQTHCAPWSTHNTTRASRRARLSSSTLVGLLTATQPDRRQQLLVVRELLRSDPIEAVRQ